MTRFRTWFEYAMKKICPRCKQVKEDTIVGLINLGGFKHDRDECPMREAPRINSCPHCGMDID